MRSLDTISEALTLIGASAVFWPLAFSICVLFKDWRRLRDERRDHKRLHSKITEE